MTAKIAVKDRVANGLCPTCGKEAAPYYLCWYCRGRQRLVRCLKRGVRHGVLSETIDHRFALVAGYTQEQSRQWGKWSTKLILPESDGRGRPRLRGIRVDVDGTLMRVIAFIGRPCTIDEIVKAWGRLRDKRNAPLASDLGSIIQAADRRARKNARRAAAWEKSQRHNVAAE